MDIQTLRDKLQHNQERRAWFSRELARRNQSGLDVARERRWLAVYDRECGTLARMLREALAVEQAKQAAELTRNARFIAEHDCAAVLAINAATLTVCGSYTGWLASGRKVTGFRIEQIANTRAAAREYLGY